ncbi:hypothetical protein EA462_06670 [Natrarchaeobius halalkaliphilus]|uniref:Halobacterial output domain-containing protein n=1 Tax=Natrarchaeobius halalkaliphilus TaxID=1679091 RepID=A0A3N6LSU0_9EURY|nr:HalOD1 output domain-containing protein [Natrarchaeobius halalkaliphilus]RQG91627.1 hypothetical protein EA462_06670 [Natrarchaeobius halalkaliphilus]
MTEYRRNRSVNECLVRVEVDEHEQPSVAVIRAIEQATSDEPAEMRPLFEFVSPESLDRLFVDTNSTTRRGIVEFSLERFEVRIVDGQYVELREHGATS